MDSKLRRTVILLIALVLVPVFTVVILTNVNKIKNDNNMTTVSASKEETVVLIDKDNSGTGYSFEKIGNDTSHWKKDDTFFDNEKDTLTQRLIEEMITLTIKVFSSERDLRVQIIDYQGNFKSGEQFMVTAMDAKTHEEFTASDDDCDGIVYFSNIKPSEYIVYLKPAEGYIVPENGEAIIVRDKVEYAVMEDISLKFVNESDVNIDADDTMQITAALDADKKLKTKIESGNSLVYGIDISSRDGDIDWNAVYDSGIHFVMLRAGYRGAESGKIIVDKNFYSNAKAAIYAGLDVGAYFYSQAVSELEAVEEASALLTLTSEFNTSLPLTIRLDMAGGQGRADELSAEKRTEVVRAFCETINNSGEKACLYASKNWLETNVHYSELKKTMLWLAEYKEPPTYDEYYDIWQYSHKGHVNGIAGDVCLNILYIN